MTDLALPICHCFCHVEYDAGATIGSDAEPHCCQCFADDAAECLLIMESGRHD